MFNIVNRIQTLCKEHKIDSIYELAKVTNIRQSTLQNIMSGNIKSPKSDTIEKICIGLGITLAEFFSESIEESPEKAQKITTGLIPVVNGIMKMDDIKKAKEQSNLDDLNDLTPDEVDLIMKYRQMKDTHKNMMHTVADNVIPTKDEQSATMGK